MKKILLYIYVLFISNVVAQQTETITLNWNSKYEYDLGDFTVKIPQFQNEHFEYNVISKTIGFRKVIDVSNVLDNNALQITNVVYENINANDLYDLDKSQITASLNASFETANARGIFKGFLC
jgi:hypothetical protein